MADRTRSHVIIGLLLIIFGVLFIARNYDLVDYKIPDFLLSWSGFLMILGALLFFLAQNKTSGVVLFSIGFIFSFPGLWPLLLILVGLHFILRKDTLPERWRKKFGNIKNKVGGQNSTHVTDSEFNDVAIFGGGSKIFYMEGFTGGNVTAIFGGSEIDLRNCTLADGDNVIEITAIFGGTTLLVPKEWHVVVDIVPIFGGFGDKRFKNPNTPTDANKKLIVKGICLFGGGEIKN